jgi:MFS family permease
VNRWEKSGIVTFGRTNTPEFGIKGITEPDAWGSCKNPWNLAHNSGGSSGGSASAVAGGIVPIAMRVIFQNFSAGQQGRGQALYSTMWGIGVASGSILAGQYWGQFGGATIFIYAAAATLTGLLFLSGLPNQVEPTKST